VCPRQGALWGAISVTVVGVLTTPAMLARTALYLLLAQLLLVAGAAAVVPHASEWLTVAGFVTPYYDNNVFAIKILVLPWTDPAVYVSVQTLTQMVSLALMGSALITLFRTNPWQSGPLPESTPAASQAKSAPRADSGGAAGAGGAAAAAGPASPRADSGGPGAAPKAG